MSKPPTLSQAKRRAASHAADIVATPIKDRRTPTKWIQTLLFGLFFDAACLSINTFQFLCLPLLFLGYVLPPARRAYERLIDWTKENFARTLVFMTQAFGPTKFVVTFEMDEQGGEGERTLADPEKFVKRDARGNVIGLALPERIVMISNHQLYADWLYLWCLAYFGDLHGHILIVLKKSLKWLPIVGWGMQFFRFIFLARSWTSDKGPLGKHLSQAAEEASEANKKLLLLIFPEGTLVSPNTRPVSKKYADKMGLSHPTNMLLPRSTGLFFCLRTLAPRVPDLALLDITVGYPGIPPAGVGQDYYTLRSIYMQGHAPPLVHLHVRISRVNGTATSPSTIPLGSLNPSREFTTPSGSLAPTAGDDVTEEEKAAFDEWLRKMWMEKDERMSRFYERGCFEGAEELVASLSSSPSSSSSSAPLTDGKPVVDGDALTAAVGNRGKAVVIDVKLGNRFTELADIFCWFTPWLVFGWAWRIWKASGGQQ